MKDRTIKKVDRGQGKGLLRQLIDTALTHYGYKRDFTGAGNASPLGSYGSAQFGRLVNDWQSNGLSADRLMDGNIKTMRDRSRQLARNNDYYIRFLAELKANVLGSSGIRLNLKGKLKDPNGKADDKAADMITQGWEEWNRKGSMDVTGELNGWLAQNLTLESTARDGEVLARKIKGWKENKYKFALQFWEADLLDHKYNAELPNGNKVRLGVEKDAWGRRQAYHIFTEHPGDYYWGGNRQRIPADDIIHIHRRSRFGQSRDVPWGQSTFRKLHMLEQYEETELVMARIEAGKGGFFVPKTGVDWDGNIDFKGDLITDLEPGTFEELPQGFEFQEYNPQHPNKCFADFRKAMLRSIASGLLMSYNFLASDLEGVNYTSLRAGAMNEREMWKIVQAWFACEYCDPSYSAWLEMALITQAVKLPLYKYDKFNQPFWKFRRWGWVDPLKETQANALAVDSLFTTRAQVVEESGDIDDDYEDILTARAKEDEEIKRLKIVLPGQDGSGKPLPAKPSANNPTGEGDPSDANGDNQKA